MLVFETGTEFIGFASRKLCAHCHNESNFVIRVEYGKQSILHLVPTGHSWGNILSECPVCEKKEVIVKRKIPAFVNYYSEDSLAKLRALLNDGRHLTKALVEKNPKTRKRILKNLNFLGAYEVVKFIEGAA